MSWRVFTRHDPMQFTQQVLLSKQDGPSRYFVVNPVELKEREYGELIKDATFNFYSHEEYLQFLQAFVDEAWEHGVVARKATPQTDVLEATKYHLEDFRRLVFKDEPTESS